MIYIDFFFKLIIWVISGSQKKIFIALSFANISSREICTPSHHNRVLLPSFSFAFAVYDGLPNFLFMFKKCQLTCNFYLHWSCSPFILKQFLIDFALTLSCVQSHCNLSVDIASNHFTKCIHDLKPLSF